MLSRIPPALRSRVGEFGLGSVWRELTTGRGPMNEYAQSGCRVARLFHRRNRTLYGVSRLQGGDVVMRSPRGRADPPMETHKGYV